MSKRLFQDMVKTKNKKILKAKIVPREEAVVEIIHTKKNSHPLLWFVALVSIVFCFFAFSFLFSEVEISVNPKTKEISLKENLTANKDSGVNGLNFNLVIVEGDESRDISVTGEKDVSLKARGVVVIYNTFSSATQVLDIDTRLEGSNGKIYKTKERMVVPGVGKDGKPGSKEVEIYAEKAGEEYNSVPLDFKIFGFKGTAKYAKFYGRSKGEISGGFVGKAPDISSAEKDKIVLELKESLQAKLLQRSVHQIPEGFVLFKDAIFLETDDSYISSAYNKENNNMTFTLKGVLYGILFNEEKLIKKIASRNIEKYDESPVFLSNLKDLTFSLTSPSGVDGIALQNAKSISFSLNGSTKVIWKLNEEQFVGDLLGKSKKDFTQILADYPNIDSASLVITPPWKMSIPDKSENIKIIVNYYKQP